MIKQEKISLDKLAALRLILAWVIVFYHTYRYLGVPHVALSWIAFLGPLATDLFFIISGISIALLYTDRIQKGEISFKVFFIRRLSKLYPLLILILPHVLFSWALLIRGDVLDGANLPISFWEKTLACIYPYLLLDAWKLGYTPGISPTWVISAFAFCYLAFFFWVKYVSAYVQKYVWWWVAGLSGLSFLVSCLGVLYMDYPRVGQLLHTFPPVRFILFLLGATWVWALNRITSEQWTAIRATWQGRIAKIALVLLVVLGFYLVAQFVWPILEKPTTVWRLFFASFTAVLVVLLASSSASMMPGFLKQALRRWTNYSLPLFILHIPLSVWYFRFWQAWRMKESVQLEGIKPLLSKMKQAGYFEQEATWKYVVFLILCWLVSSFAYRWAIAPFSEWVRKRTE